MKKPLDEYTVDDVFYDPVLRHDADIIAVQEGEEVTFTFYGPSLIIQVNPDFAYSNY